MNHNSGLGGPGYIEFITRDKEYILSLSREMNSIYPGPPNPEL